MSYLDRREAVTVWHVGLALPRRVRAVAAHVVALDDFRSPPLASSWCRSVEPRDTREHGVGMVMAQHLGGGGVDRVVPCQKLDSPQKLQENVRWMDSENDAALDGEYSQGCQSIVCAARLGFVLCASKRGKTQQGTSLHKIIFRHVQQQDGTNKLLSP